MHSLRKIYGAVLLHLQLFLRIHLNIMNGHPLHSAMSMACPETQWLNKYSLIHMIWGRFCYAKDLHTRCCLLLIQAKTNIKVKVTAMRIILCQQGRYWQTADSISAPQANTIVMEDLMLCWIGMQCCSWNIIKTLTFEKKKKQVIINRLLSYTFNIPTFAWVTKRKKERN